MRTAALFLALALASAGCRVDAAQDPPPPRPAPASAPRGAETAGEEAPSGKRALRWIESFCALGARVPGTPGAERARRAILAAIEEAGCKAIRERHPLPTTRGEIEFQNLMVELPGRSARRIVWAAHYDTPDVAEDAYWQTTFEKDAVFVGANDGGSGIAVLLELLRALKVRGEPALTHVFLFLDGEERIGPPPFIPNLEDPKANACFGARAQALRWRDEKKLPAAFVLLDMVGDKELEIVQETTYSDSRLLDLFARAARTAGVGETQFISERGMMDDHVPFHEAGVPAIDLIDWNYGPPDARGKAGAWWHTPEDTPDKLSAQSLETTARICLAAVSELEKFALVEK